MATGENVLWMVHKHRYHDGTVLATYVFRTRKAAIEFSDGKNIRGRKFEYTYPARATWGPEQ